ncbi:heme-containing dehydratase protein [Naematelia encephala]|uniref:Heme-containing dehydratase protein n=1 Tax=Naematelia encephala TaxID=71784 RepID=A0A1Y2APS9_9TREE|nr:heme-containing dehydratase protein [Naematelia encephala]
MPPISKLLPHAPPGAYTTTARITPLRKPPGFTPTVQRWSALLPESELYVGFFGVQSEDNGVDYSSPFHTWVKTNLLEHVHGPSTHDYAQFTDQAGHTNHVVSAYWVHQTSFSAWRSDMEVEGFWASPELETSRYGHWREILRVPADRFETIYWLDYQRALSADANVQLYPTPFCGYYGAMRDRIPLSAVDKLDPGPVASPILKGRDTTRSRWRVRPPNNLAVIRSAYSWGLMDEEQKLDFDHKLAPPLARGMTFLKENADTSGCISIRTQITTDAQGHDEPEAHVTAYFLSLDYMERWSEMHKTHAAIFGAAMQRYRHYGDRNQLRTWHEVFVLPDDREQLFEYTNCHSGTGLLAQFQGERVG